jgi:hypothetical protein
MNDGELITSFSKSSWDVFSLRGDKADRQLLYSMKVGVNAPSPKLRTVIDADLSK